MATSGSRLPRAASARVPCPRAQAAKSCAGAGVRKATYTASRPSTWIAALCMEGESEWETGSPITASSRVLALTSTRELFDDALHRGLQQRLELGAGVAIHIQVATEGVAD